MNKALIALMLLGMLCTTNSQARECVVLVHGLAKSSASMAYLEKILQRHRYHTINIDYPSRTAPIPVLAERTLPAALAACGEYHPRHLVTHSMGGILVRHYLATHEDAQVGRVIMLAPPNGGSELIDRFRIVPGFRQAGGPAAMQLGTGPGDLPNALGSARFELGIIAGERSINPVLSRFSPSQDDGKVSVEHTKLEGMHAHLTLPVSHPLISHHPWVAHQVLSFLESGAFIREQGRSDVMKLHTWRQPIKRVKSHYAKLFWPTSAECTGSCR